MTTVEIRAAIGAVENTEVRTALEALASRLEELERRLNRRVITEEEVTYTIPLRSGVDLAEMVRALDGGAP